MILKVLLTFMMASALSSETGKPCSPMAFHVNNTFKMNKSWQGYGQAMPLTFADFYCRNIGMLWIISMFLQFLQEVLVGLTLIFNVVFHFFHD